MSSTSFEDDCNTLCFRVSEEKLKLDAESSHADDLSERLGALQVVRLLFYLTALA